MSPCDTPLRFLHFESLFGSIFRSGGLGLDTHQLIDGFWVSLFLDVLGILFLPFSSALELLDGGI